MEHEIIQDLLPLYHDGVCSDKSRAAVEAHLKDCPDCRAALAEMDTPLPGTEQTAADDAAVVKGISRKWESGKKKAWLKGAVIAAAVCVMAFGGWYGLTQWQFTCRDMAAYQVSEVAQLRDGRITFHVAAKDGEVLPFMFWEEDENGGTHLVRFRTIIEQEQVWKKDLDGYCVYDVAEENTWSQVHGDGSQVTSIYLGSGEGAVLIWEEGMELPPANAAQEAKYGYEPGSAEYWSVRE